MTSLAQLAAWSDSSRRSRVALEFGNLVFPNLAQVLSDGRLAAAGYHPIVKELSSVPVQCSVATIRGSPTHFNLVR